MKKLLIFLLIATTFAACDCKHGYGPNNCKDTWASNYTGTWSQQLECGSNTFANTVTVTELNPIGIFIDYKISARLDSWDKFTIPSQQLDGATVSGRGGLIDNTTTSNTGALINIGTTIWYEITLEQNGQTVFCSAQLN